MRLRTLRTRHCRKNPASTMQSKASKIATTVQHVTDSMTFLEPTAIAHGAERETTYTSSPNRRFPKSAAESTLVDPTNLAQRTQLRLLIRLSASTSSSSLSVYQ